MYVSVKSSHAITLVRCFLLLALVALGLSALPGAADATASRVRPARPVVSKISVRSGPTTGGVKVTISGRNLEGVTKVTFGGVQGSRVRVLSARKVTVLAPRSEVGLVHVQVTTKGGRSRATGKDTFTYQRYAPLTSGYYHTCRVKSGGVRCLGYNASGQLGDGTKTNSTSPVVASGVSKAVAVSSTNETTCALNRTGSVWCWGYNVYGELGDNTTTDSTSPKRVPGLSHVVQIVAGYYQTCAIKADRSLWCWGYNGYGELGDGTMTERHVPTRVSGIGKVVEVDANYYFTCARTVKAQVYCWGHNDYGQLGNGTTADSTAPVHVVGLRRVTSLSTAWYSACAAAAGQAYCWGYNGYGELGNGSTDNASTPQVVAALHRVTDVSSGGDFNCALAVGGSFCWGDSYYGQLGNGAKLGTYDSRALTPSGVKDADGVQFFATGAYNGCFQRGATVKCWGYNYYGEVGDGTTTDQRLPQPTSL